MGSGIWPQSKIKANRGQNEKEKKKMEKQNKKIG